MENERDEIIYKLSIHLKIAFWHRAKKRDVWSELQSN